MVKNIKSNIFLLSIGILDLIRISANMGNTSSFFSVLFFIVVYACIIFLIHSFFHSNKEDLKYSTKLYYNAFVIWLTFQLFRSLFNINDYYDWKFLFGTSIPFTFICLAFYLGFNLKSSQLILNKNINIIYPFALLTYFLLNQINSETYHRIVISISFFFPLTLLWPKKRIILVITMLVAVLSDITFRTGVLKALLTISIMIPFIVFNKIPKRLILICHKILFLIPFVFLYLGYTSTFNIFKDFNSSGEKIEIGNTDSAVSDLAADTRTFIYQETLSSLNSLDDLLFGKGAVGKYKSFHFYNTGGAIKGMRYGSEVGILNSLLRYGVIGVLLYFLLLYNITKSAITNSNNKFIIILSLIISSRWPLSFIEEFTQFDTNFFFFWFFLGLISNELLINSSDKKISHILKI
ncbi:hypothetical protein [Flammeovirga sp. OC4]|uniref:hypothetical protein n=1 Tax=Flammeovirga sp. OC4 TaxID=1382345 RepID=UPI0012E086B5|nr:hypothetical protein [Flammeovirga sp. OC4]